MSERPSEGVVSARSDGDGIEIVRVFDAPRELVYRAWTEREGLAAWFGEHGSSIPLETFTMDARVGGTFSLVMIHQEMELPFAGRFLELEEPERVSFTITDATTPPDAPDEILTAVFEDLGDGTTRMTFTQRGGNLPPDEYSRAMRGELIFFDRLSEHFKTRHDTEA